MNRQHPRRRDCGRGPSLRTEPERIYFAGAEASAMRWAREGEGTGTLVGTGLFGFGDRDMVGDEVRLQHTRLSVVGERGELLVADTYNHRIKRVDPETREARAVAGSGVAGMSDGAAEEARFWKPGGLALSLGGAHAFVADTNNHALRVVDLASGRAATLPMWQ